MLSDNMWRSSRTGRSCSDSVMRAVTPTTFGRAKVAVLAEGPRGSATVIQLVIQGVEFSVVEDENYQRALDCDVLFSCVDRPWPRTVLNLVAHAHLIPVVDGGIDVETGWHGLRNAHWRALVAAPGRRYLEYIGQYDPDLVQLERKGLLDDAQYIRGLPENHTFRRNENVFPFSLSVGSFEVLQFLRMVVASGGLAHVCGDDYRFTQDQLRLGGETCLPSCPHSAASSTRERRERGDGGS